MARPGAARTNGVGRLGRPRQRFPTQCPLLAHSGHGFVRCQCPLLGVKRTSPNALHMSAFDPKRTSTARDLFRSASLSRYRLRSTKLTRKGTRVMRPRATEYCAWNPGLESELPREYLLLSTVFHSENVSSSVVKAHELSEYCGLPAHELVAFRPDRLIVHEVLIHVTTGISVPDGHDYEDLGRNFREIAATILNRYVAARREELLRAFEQVRAAASIIIERELTKAFPGPKIAVRADAGGGWRRLIGFGQAQISPLPSTKTPAERELRIITEWRKRAETSNDSLEVACFDALNKVAMGVFELSRPGLRRHRVAHRPCRYTGM